MKKLEFLGGKANVGKNPLEFEFLQRKPKEAIKKTDISHILEHSQQMFYKKCHFDALKAYFIILPHHFTTFHLSDILSFNSIH